MQSQTTKFLLAIIITAIVAVGGTYYFLNNQRFERQTLSNDDGISKTTESEQENIVLNKSSKEYAVMSREMFSAFECSFWASVIEDSEEAERLFTSGYKLGKEFLGAVDAQKIEQKDWSSEVPIGVSMVLQGPSKEFILGRIYDSAVEDVSDEIFKTGDEFNSDETQKSIASNKYRDGNCQLIGK
jgi:hypothetical protein